MEWFVSSEDQSLGRKNEMKLGRKELNLLEHIDLLASEKQNVYYKLGPCGNLLQEHKGSDLTEII